jgi:copper chaperone CopZ
MTHTYILEGMTCNGCAAKVKSALLKHPDVLQADIDLDSSRAMITMQKHIPVSQLQELISQSGNYTIKEEGNHHAQMIESGEIRSWWSTYKPLLLIFAYITGISTLIEFSSGTFSFMHWMNYFMGGFFLTFSFFKMLNLKDFASSYAMYDIVAKRFYTYGYIYPFIELLLGIAYLTHFDPFITNAANLIVMGISSIGVLQSLLNKQQIRCACLGAVFNLPMSTVTLVEDLLMVVMSGAMLLIVS